MQARKRDVGIKKSGVACATPGLSWNILLAKTADRYIVVL
jgi:hypothetical protein